MQPLKSIFQRKLWSGSGLANKSLRDYGIEENFGHDSGIEEPYWGPSLGVIGLRDIGYGTVGKK